MRAKKVALLAEGVDRNSLDTVRTAFPLVALLAEGVDRNFLDFARAFCLSVALLAEGVDRNFRLGEVVVKAQSRPPRGGRG